MDRSAKMIEIARRNIPAIHDGNVSMVDADLLDYAGPPDRYDVVLCVGVLAHVASVEAAIARIADLLVAGGRGVVQISDHDQMLTGLIRAYGWLRRRLPGPQLFSTNETRLSSVRDLASRHGLRRPWPREVRRSCWCSRRRLSR